MKRILVWPIAFLAACGDLKFDETSTLPTAPPPGSTTSNGSVSANLSGEQFFGRLQSAATFVETRIEFSAYDGNTRQLTFAVDVPGPGTYEVGGPYKPVVSLIEGSGNETRRWISSQTPGLGSITFTFLSQYKAIGTFFFALFPDSATVAAGFTNRRNVTVGTFDINVSR